MLAVGRRALRAGASVVRSAPRRGAIDASTRLFTGVASPGVSFAGFGGATVGAASKASGSKAIWGLAAGGIGAAAIYSSEEEFRDVVPVGTIQGKREGSSCFVPGSISDAVEVGSSFIKSWEENAGEEICFINSNMPITDYPSQSFGTESAKKRNSLVENGVVSFIENNPNDTVEIFAHSAGTKSALAAVRKYMKKSGKKKNINIYIMGAGTPEGGLEEDYQSLIKSGVKVTEIRDRSDFVPALSGTAGIDCIVVDTDVSRDRSAAIKRACGDDIADSVGLEDMESTARNFIVALSMMVEAHYVGNYLPTLLEQVKKDRMRYSAKVIAKKMGSSAVGEVKVGGDHAAVAPKKEKKWEVKL